MIMHYFQVHLVVATPGRILDLMEKRVANVEKCKLLCLDEADKLLSQDFKGMLDRLISHLPQNRQVRKMLISKINCCDKISVCCVRSSSTLQLSR